MNNPTFVSIQSGRCPVAKTNIFLETLMKIDAELLQIVPARQSEETLFCTLGIDVATHEEGHRIAQPKTAETTGKEVRFYGRDLVTADDCIMRVDLGDLVLLWPESAKRCNLFLGDDICSHECGHAVDPVARS